MVGRDDVLAVDLEAGQALDDRARGHDQVLGLELPGADLDRVAVADAALALDHFDLVLLHEVLDALVELAHDGVAALRDARIVVADDLRLQTELGAAGGDAVVELRGLEQRFGRDAADVETRPAQLVGLDQPNLQAEL